MTTLGSYGSGSDQFDGPRGVAVDGSGNIYVADSGNHRVQVYNSSRVHQATLGVTGVSGSDNAHFDYPYGVAIDSSGNVYVANGENNRVQKCTVVGTGGTCTLFAGVTGEWGDDFDHFSVPRDVAVDGQGRIYVADIHNQRVQVFDSSGAYLTTVGGEWGTNIGQLREPAAVDVDAQGNVYVAENRNHRIQKFAPGVPGWEQVNINGFGDRNNWAANLSVFGSYLYAGTVNDETGGEAWRTANGTTWNQVNLDGFGVVSNTRVLAGENLNGYLYVGTENSATGGEIWRCATCDGSDWTQVVSGGFGDSNNTLERIVVFSNTLYATTNNDVTGVEVWKTSTGVLGSWTQCNTDGFGDNKNTGLWAVAVFNGHLYVATAQWGAYGTGTHTGVEVWRTSDGVTWSQVNTDGFGDHDNVSPWMASFDGYLYVLYHNYNTGAQIWRCATCNGTDWTRVVSDGFGDSNNPGGNLMLGFGDYFYACTSNGTTGTEIWQTANGTDWSQVNVDGFGDSNNVDVWGGAVFKGRLFLSTVAGKWGGPASGVEVWMMLHQVYLPLVLRNN